MKFKTAAVCLLAIALTTSGRAQTSVTPDPETVALTKRIEVLEQALAEVKAELARRPGASSMAPDAASVVAAASVAQSPSPDASLATLPPEDSSHTLGPVQFHGYSDFTYGRPVFSALPTGPLSNTTNGFSLGDFDLFATAQLGNHFSMLGELLITSDFTNEFSAEMDRLMLTYTANDYFQISAGKYNTAIGFYSNEFNRARYFQTATGRPLLFTDEDDGGILPVHSIGLTANGKIPSGGLGLHWVAEIANGRSSATVQEAVGASEAVQNFVDENNGKAVNFALYARPTKWNGFQTGVSFLTNRMYPSDFSPLKQRIYSAYAALVKPHLELLAEGVYLRHDSTTNQQRFNTVSSYAQASYMFGRIRPYFRYEYQNVPDSDPIFGILGRKDGPTVGVHFDFSDFVAFKIQYGRLGTYSTGTANDVQLQFAFAF